ncbi:helix-turn-helix domain-containing protein [Rhizobium sp.]
MPKYSTERSKFAGSPLAKRFGNLLSAHRRKLKLTQRELAERTNLSVDMVAKLETAATGASLSTVQLLADALGIDPAELFTAEIPRGALHRAELSDLMATLARLSEQEFAGVRGVIDAALRMR